MVAREIRSDSSRPQRHARRATHYLRGQDAWRSRSRRSHHPVPHPIL